LFGLVAGMALLTKSSARLFLGLSALAPILFIDDKIKRSCMKLVNFGFLFGIVVFLALAMYNIQRLSPYMHYIDLKNTTFVMTLGEWKELTLPEKWGKFLSNAQTVPTYVFWELGWVMIPFALLGIYQLFRKNWRLACYLTLWIVIPYFGVALLTKVLFPRYLIFFGTLFFVFAAYFLSQMKNKKIQMAAIGIVVLFQVYWIYPILFNPAALNFPPTDRGQYVSGRTAVWGAQDIMNYAREKSKEKPVVILAEGDFGLVGDVLDVFLREGDRIEVRGIWPLEGDKILESQNETKDKYVYAVFPHREEFPPNWPLTLIKKYEKPNGDSILYFFEVKSKN
jgi:hypothetical protein